MNDLAKVRRNCWFRVITFIVITTLLCHDIAWAGGSWQSKLSPGHVDVERLQNDALDAFLGDERTGPYVFRHGRLPTPPRGLAKVLDGFLEVTGKAIIEGGIARIEVKIDGKPAILCFSREPSADGRRYWFETAASLKAPGSKDLTPDGIRYIETLLSLKETFVVKDEAEPNIIGRAVEEIRRRIPNEKNDWQDITPGMIRVNIVDLDDGIGIPRYPGSTTRDLIYAYSRIDDDGRLGIYITKELWEREILRDDGIDILFLAELIDHEWQEKYLGRPHSFIAGRARYFCEDNEGISCFHKFYLKEIITKDGRDGIDFLISLLEEERDAGDSSIRTYEERFRGFIRDLLKIPQEIPDSVPAPIKEAILRETKGEERIFAVQNLYQPELQGYCERALRKNITLIICREFQNAPQSKRQRLLRYLDILLEAIEKLPSGLIDKAGSPLVLKVGKIADKETMGQAHVRNTGGYARVAVTQFSMAGVKPKPEQLEEDSGFDVDSAFNKRRIANTLAHEIIGHKLSTVWNRKGGMIMPRQDWIDIAVINGVESVCIVGDEQLEAIRRHYSTTFQRVPIDELPEEEREFLQAIRRIYRLPHEYYEILHELVAYSVTNDDLKEGDRNTRHRLEETRKVLRRNLLREELPVDKVKRIYRGHEFNGREWVEYYIQNIGTDERPTWETLSYNYLKPLRKGKGPGLWIPFLASVSLALALLVPKMHLYPKGYSYIQVILWRNILSIVVLTISVVLPRYIITAWRQLKEKGEEVTLKGILRVVMANIRKEIERDWRVFTYVGIMLRGFAAICTFGALVYTSAFNVSLFMASTIVVVLLIDTFINLGRRFSVTDSLLNRITGYRPNKPKLHQFTFALLAGIGIYIALGGSSIDFTIGTVGLIILLLQSVLWGSSIIYQNNFNSELLKKGETFDPINIVNYSLIIGTVCFIIYGIFASMISPLFMGTAAQGLFYNLSIDSILTPIKHYLDLGLTSITMLVYYLFSHTAPKYTKPASFFIMISAYPLFVALFSWMFYGAGIYSYQIIGAIIVVAGISLFNYWSKGRNGETEGQPAASQPQKGVLISSYWLADKLASPFEWLCGRKISQGFKEDIIVPIIEETALIGLSFGHLGFYWFLRLVFIGLHAIQDRAPPKGKERTLYEKIFIPAVIGLAVFLPFSFSASIQLLSIFITATLLHISLNLFVTVTGVRLQKGLIGKEEIPKLGPGEVSVFANDFAKAFVDTRLGNGKNSGLCVTGDTLLPIISAGEIQNDPDIIGVPRSKIQNTPIVDVQPGDYVLSLNEETQRIEPHRINGLLDMGVKPVYRLTTASGRSIKTTANHPYLTRHGWAKVSRLRGGDEIGVPSYFLTRKSVSSTTNNLLLNALNDENLESRFFIAVISFLAEGGCILRRIIPQYLRGGYINILEKCTSLVINILFSLDASFITSPFLAPLCTLLTSWPRAIRYSATSRLIFSSIRNFILRFNYKRAILLTLNHFGSKMEASLDMLFGNGRVTSDNLFWGISCFKEFQDQVYHYPRPLKTGLPMADIGICGDVIFNSHNDSSFSLHEKFYQNLRAMSSFVMPEVEGAAMGGDILWDRIASIEYTGYEHVYDIEVEGTHNFIGNGIFAHNTYIKDPNVSCGTICESGHEGSYNALDEQLKRQFEKLREILGITEERELTEEEADKALVEYAKMFGIKVSIEELQKYRRRIKEAVGQIDIFFAIPETGTELFWAGDDYAGGHFNGAGTRIHISLPIILEHGIEAGISIARHELAHIQDKGHEDNKGMVIVREIAQKDRDVIKDKKTEEIRLEDGSRFEITKIKMRTTPKLVIGNKRYNFNPSEGEYTVLRYWDKEGKSAGYFVTYPDSSGNRAIRISKRTRKGLDLSEFESRLEEARKGIDDERVIKDKKFNPSGFREAHKMFGGVLYQGYLLLYPEKLKAFIYTKGELDTLGTINECNLQSELSGFGYPVGYISSCYKLYKHYLDKGLNLAERYGVLLGENSGKTLPAFIQLLDEARELDKGFKLLNEANLQGVLTGFGYPVAYISSVYKLYKHYLDKGLNLAERYGVLLGENSGKTLPAFIQLLDEARGKDDKFKLLNEGNLEGVLTRFGYPVNYISSHYKLYKHYLDKGLNLAERYGVLLGENSIKTLHAFIQLLDEAREKDKGFKLLNEANLQSVLTRFGYPVAYMSSYYKLYRHYLGKGLDLAERYGVLLGENSGKTLPAFIQLLDEARKLDKGFKPLNERNLEGVLTEFGYTVAHMNSYYKLYRHYLGKGLNLAERYGVLLGENSGKTLPAFIQLLDEARGKDDKFKLLKEGNLQGVLTGFGYPVDYINREYKLYQYWKEKGVDVDVEYNFSGFDRELFRSVLRRVITIGLPKGKFSASMGFYLIRVLVSLGKIAPHRPVSLEELYLRRLREIIPELVVSAREIEIGTLLAEIRELIGEGDYIRLLELTDSPEGELAPDEKAELARLVKRVIEAVKSKGTGNVSCGTICESGHEGSYNALDEQLERQFGELRKILGITEERDLTEEEADRALVEYAKRFGIEVSVEELQGHRRRIKEVVGQIDIFFAIPETGTELFWVGDDYAGGHFNRAGTRIHISLPIIMKRGIEAGIAIARHELSHIQGKGHNHDEGIRIVEETPEIEILKRLGGEKLGKDDILSILGLLNWNLMRFYSLVIYRFGGRHVSLVKLIRRLGIVSEFLKKFKGVYIEKRGEVYMENQGNIEETARRFGLRGDELKELLRAFGRDIQGKKGLIEFREGELLEITGKTKKEIMEIIIQKEWKLPAVAGLFRQMGWLRKNARYRDIILGLDIRGEFKEEFRRVSGLNNGKKSPTAEYFDLDEKTLYRLIHELGIDTEIMVEDLLPAIKTRALEQMDGYEPEGLIYRIFNEKYPVYGNKALLLLESIVVNYRGINFVLMPDLEKVPSFLERSAPYMAYGILENDRIYPIPSSEDQKLLGRYFSELPYTELGFKRLVMPADKFPLFSPDRYRKEFADGRESGHSGHDNILIKEIERVINAAAGEIAIVDIGMGIGNLLKKLSGRFSGDKRIHLFGCEPHEELLGLARGTLPDSVVTDGVSGRDIKEAGFADRLSGRYKIAVLEGIAATRITKPDEAHRIMEEIFRMEFDKVFITGLTPVNLDMGRLNEEMERYGYTLERTLCPENLFTNNLPKYMFVISRNTEYLVTSPEFASPSIKGRAPGGRWPWLRDLLARYSLPAWLQVPIEQVFIGLGYLLFFNGFYLPASLILPVFVLLHYWQLKERRAIPSGMDIFKISAINLAAFIGTVFMLSFGVGTPFILSAIALAVTTIVHDRYNKKKEKIEIPKEEEETEVFLASLERPVREKLLPWKEEISRFNPTQWKIFKRSLKIKGKRIAFDIEASIRIEVENFGKGDIELIKRLGDLVYTPWARPLIIGLLANNELMIMTGATKNAMLELLEKEKGFLDKLIKQGKVPFYGREDILKRLRENTELFDAMYRASRNKTEGTFIDRCTKMKLPELFGFDFLIDDRDLFEMTDELLSVGLNLTRFLFHRYGRSLIPDWLIRVPYYVYNRKRNTTYFVGLGDASDNEVIKRAVRPIFEKLEGTQTQRVIIQLLWDLKELDSGAVPIRGVMPTVQWGDSKMSREDILRIMKRAALGVIQKWLELLGGELKPGDAAEVLIPDPQANGCLVRVTTGDIVDELKRFYNTHRPVLNGDGLDARDKGVFLPAGIDDLVSIFTALDIPARLRFIDLGSGDGRVAAMAGVYNLLATGIEYEGDLFRLSLDMERILSRYIGKDKVRFINGDFMNEDLSKYDVVFYSGAGTNEEKGLKEKIMRELSDNAVFIIYTGGYEYSFTGWSRLKIDNTMVFSRSDNNPLFVKLRKNTKEHMFLREYVSLEWGMCTKAEVEGEEIFHMSGGTKEDIFRIETIRQDENHPRLKEAQIKVMLKLMLQVREKARFIQGSGEIAGLYSAYFNGVTVEEKEGRVNYRIDITANVDLLDVINYSLESIPWDRLKNLFSQGLCVTGDTLLPIISAEEIQNDPDYIGVPRSKIQNKPIVDVSPGDYVLSLNEETQKIEPHRINGLLDMGIKPVYRLTTTSGRSIKTTANHPYLTKNGWVKVSGVRRGDEICVCKSESLFPINFPAMTDLGNKNTSFFPVKDYSIISDLKTERRDRTSYYMFSKNEWISLFKIVFHFLYYSMLDILWQFQEHLFSLAGKVIGDHLRPIFFLTVLPEILPDLRDSSSDVRNSGSEASNSSSISSMVSLSNNRQRVFPFRSTRRTMPFSEKGNFILDGSINITFSSDRPFNNDDIISLPPIQKKYNTLILKLSRLFIGTEAGAAELIEGDILWDRIVSIEYLGYEHVYDIEVEGTHNFIGNGIFAHNTYVNKGERNISCGTICESGHEGSYNALDEQLKRQFGKLREILGITEERNLTEPEADKALMVYAKRHGIDITYEQLQEFRSQIKEAEEGLRSIEIFFALPETGIELWWVGDDYAGGHFNRAGTRIHISLPVILKRGIEAGVAIAKHELGHIQGRGHLEDTGLEIVKGIANVDKWVVLLNSLNWKLKAFRRYAAPLIGEGWINLADLLKRLGLVEAFREKYNKVYKERFGFVKKIADYFGISDTALRQLKKALGITDPELDIDITEGALLPVIEMGKEDVLRRLRAVRWNFKRLRKRLNLSSNLGIYELIIGLGIKEEFEKKFRQIYRARLGWYRLIAGYFDVHEKILKGIIRRLGIDVSDIEPFTRGSIIRVHKLDKQDILRMLDRCGWKLLSFRKKLAKKNIIPVSTDLSDMIIGLDIKAEFLARFDEAYRENQGNFGKTARGFGLWNADMRDLLKALGRVGFEKSGFIRFEEDQLLKITGMTLEQLMGLVRDKKWRLDELIRYFRENGWLRKRISYIDFIKGLGIVKQFSEELLKISWANSGKWGLVSDHFGVDGITLSSIVAKLGIKIEVRDEYPILERGTRLRDPSGNIYELLGPRYKGKDEVLLRPETILVLRKVDNHTISRILAKEAFTSGWEVLGDTGDIAIIPYFQKLFGRFGQTKWYKLLTGPIVEEIIFRGIPLVIGAFAFTINPILGKILIAVWSLVLYKWFVNLHEDGKRTPAKVVGLFGVLSIALPFFYTQLPWWIIFGAIIFHSSVNIFQTVMGKGDNLAIINEKGLCVTGDTLLPILRSGDVVRDLTHLHLGGVQKMATPEVSLSFARIIEVKPGDYVLSLNEQTQQIEPHRINGLLDMGIKSVYRLTTAGGRSIETTANHPYLTKNGWVKVNGLKTGDEIAVPELRSFAKDEDGKIDYQKKTGNNKEDNIIHKRLPLTFGYPDKDNQCQYSGENVKSQKIHGFFESILDSLTAILRNNTVMAMPIENVSQGIFPAASGTNTPITNEANINFAPSRKKSDTTSNLSLDNMQHNATIQKVFVNKNIYTDTKGSDVVWDRIVSIEYIGYEHVYDIEVEGTHNFIGNGIFAHNTYIKDPNVSCGTICDSRHEGTAIIPYFQKKFGRFGETLWYKLFVGPIVEEIIFRGIPLVIGAFAFTISPILGKILLAVWGFVLYKWFVNMHEEGKRTPGKIVGVVGVLSIALPFFFTQLPWWIIFGAIVFHSSFNILQQKMERKQIEHSGIEWEKESSENRLEILGENEGVVTKVYKARYKGEIYWAKFAEDEEGEERLIIPQAEIIKYLNGLNVPGVCRAEHFLELKDGRKAILFRKFPPGDLLEKRVEKLSEEERIDLMLKILYIVRDLHRAGVRHWDIKPENIWLTDSGEVILFDFDFAFRTDKKEEFRKRGLQMTMSPSYASEKRASWRKGNYPKNEAEFPHTPEELYSLGMVLLNLIADSEVPVIGEGETPYRYANKQLDRLQEKQEVPSGLRRILNRALFWGSCTYQDIGKFIKDFRMFQYRYKAEQLWFPAIEEKRRLVNEIRALGIKVIGWKRVPLEYLEDMVHILKNLREEDRKHVSTIQLVAWYRSLYFWFGSLDLAQGVVTIPIRSVFRWVLVRKLGHLIMDQNKTVAYSIARYSWLDKWSFDYKKPWQLLSFYSVLGKSEDVAEGFTASILFPGLKDTRFAEKYSLLTRNLTQFGLDGGGRGFSMRTFLFFSLFIHLMVFIGFSAPKLFFVFIGLFGYVALIILLNEPVFLHLFSDYGKWIDRGANYLSETARRAFRFGTYIISRTLYELPKLLIVAILILTISSPARIMHTLLGDEKAVGEPAEEHTVELIDLPGKPMLPGEKEETGKVDSSQEPQLQGEEATEGTTKELVGSTPGNVQKGGRITQWRGDYWYHGRDDILLYKYDVIADNIRFNLSGYHSVVSLILVKNWRYSLNIEPFKELIIHIKDIEAGRVRIQIHGPGPTADDDTVLEFEIKGGPQDIHIPTSIIEVRRIKWILIMLYPVGDKFYEKHPFRRPLNIESLELVPKEKPPAKKVPGGRWLWLSDLLARYGLPSWLQVPIEQAFIGLGYVLYYSGFHILSWFIIPVFIGLHYVWKKGRAPSIRDILLVSLINLMGFVLATPILATFLFILSSLGHYFYNKQVEAGKNISCGTVCESGHEGSYDALDEQLMRQFEKLRRIQRITKERDLTEEEADRALVKYARSFGIRITYEQLQEFRRQIKDAEEGVRSIEIFFSIPETGTGLWWVGDDYAGGHFNRAGTRMHISLPIILERGIEAGISIARHELAHIQGNGHQNDKGRRIVKRIAKEEKKTAEKIPEDTVSRLAVILGCPTQLAFRICRMILPYLSNKEKLLWNLVDITDLINQKGRRIIRHAYATEDRDFISIVGLNQAVVRFFYINNQLLIQEISPRNRGNIPHEEQDRLISFADSVADYIMKIVNPNGFSNEELDGAVPEERWLYGKDRIVRPLYSDEIYVIISRINQGLIRMGFFPKEGIGGRDLMHDFGAMGSEMGTPFRIGVEQRVKEHSDLFNALGLDEDEFLVFLARDGLSAFEFLNYLDRFYDVTPRSGLLYQPGLPFFLRHSNYVPDENLSHVMRITGRIYHEVKKELSIPEQTIPDGGADETRFDETLYQEFSRRFKEKLITVIESDEIVRREAGFIYLQLKRIGVLMHKKIRIVGLNATGRTIYYVKAVLEYFAEKEGVGFDKVDGFVGYGRGEGVGLPKVRHRIPDTRVRFRDVTWPFAMHSRDYDTGMVTFRAIHSRYFVLLHAYHSLLLFNEAVNLFRQTKGMSLGMGQRSFTYQPKGKRKRYTRHKTILDLTKEEFLKSYYRKGYFRPGHFGKKIDDIYKRLDEWFGKGNWQVCHFIGGKFVPTDKALESYEDAYVEYFRSHPGQLEWLVNEARDVYDNSITNIQSGTDYSIQETKDHHFHDIAIRRAVNRLGKEFKGKRYIQIRGHLSRGYHLNPGIVPFHRPGLILRPELEGWWKPGSIEAFYQSNKVIILNLPEIKAVPVDLDESLEDLPAARGIEVDADIRVETSV